MDLAKALGEMFRLELQAKLAPLQTAVRRMDEGLEALEMLRSATFRLAPLTSRLGAMAGVRTPSVLPELEALRGAVRRGRPPAAKAAPGRAAKAPAPGRAAKAPAPGRAAKAPAPSRAAKAPAPGRNAKAPAPGRAAKAPAPVAAKRARADEGTRACAVMGCKRPSRSKGYCSAHYQKLRLLMRTNRRPAEWVDDAKPQSVREVKLPRGRAASKALKERAPRTPPPPAAPSKPKVWVRKKGKGMVSLH